MQVALTVKIPLNQFNLGWTCHIKVLLFLCDMRGRVGVSEVLKKEGGRGFWMRNFYFKWKHEWMEEWMNPLLVKWETKWYNITYPSIVLIHSCVGHCHLWSIVVRERKKESISFLVAASLAMSSLQTLSFEEPRIWFWGPQFMNKEGDY